MNNHSTNMALWVGFFRRRGWLNPRGRCGYQEGTVPAAKRAEAKGGFMLLKGSCHCGAVGFAVESPHPYPFNLCYCSICRKTAGGGGFAINLSARAETLEVEGAEHLRTYHARMGHDATGAVIESLAERKFCGISGSAHWLWDPGCPDLLHPHASAIDTELPVPPEHTHLRLDSRAGWVEPCFRPGDRRFQGFPDESIAEWHRRLGLER
jgi:hypothetical protein